MHDPVGLSALGCAAKVEHQSLLHAYQKMSAIIHHIPVLTCGLPIPLLSGSVGSYPRWILPVSQAEEIPFLLPYFRFLRKIPGLAFVEAHVRNRLHGKVRVFDLSGQVEADELIISRMEAKPWWKLNVAILFCLHGILAVAHA